MLHAWQITPSEAIALQSQLAHQVVDDVPLPLTSIRTIAGVDVSVRGRESTAAVVVLSFPDMRLVQRVRACADTPFPYIPGLLSFREMPVILRAFEQLHTMPDVLMVDGMGRIHPRQFGIACHLGLWMNLPSIGVGKTPFIGTHAPLGAEKGANSPIIYHDEILGVALRTRENTKPLYISVGHLCDLQTAMAVVMACVGKYRQPEPIRHAHHVAGQL